MDTFISYAEEYIVSSKLEINEEGILFNEVKDLMLNFAKMHTVKIIKELSKSELEYQRNIHLLQNIK